MSKLNAANKLLSRFGANMGESMDDVKPGAGGIPAGLSVAPAGQYAGCTRIKDALSIEVDRVSPDPDQPRKEFDPMALEELAGSLKARGQLQPIRVRWDAGMERWIIVAGERRWRASRLADLTHIQAIEARGAADPDTILEDQLVENCLREDLKPIEEAHAYRALMSRRGWSYSELGGFLNISKGKISKALALLDLPEQAQALVEEGKLAPHAAYEISRLEDDDLAADLAREVVEARMTAEDVADRVRELRPRSKGKASAKGRGVAAPKKRVARFAGGKVTIEATKGVTPEAIRAAADALLMLLGGGAAEAA
jgi:ParB family chromosome partitioning protein